MHPDDLRLPHDDPWDDDTRAETDDFQDMPDEWSDRMKLDIDALLNECCARETYRYGIDHPCKVGEFVCATNGRIIVRTRHEAKYGPIEGQFPPIDDLGWDGSFSETPLALPMDHEFHPDAIPCVGCDGTGKGGTCDECNGTGKCECWECGSITDCEDCDGEGVVEKCQRCDGAGVDEPEWRVFDFGCVGLNEKYLKVIMRHGGKVYPMIECAAIKPVRVVFDDKTDGLLMPVNLGNADPVRVVRVTREATT